jgi:hypothetical protein
VKTCPPCPPPPPPAVLGLASTSSTAEQQEEMERLRIGATAHPLMAPAAPTALKAGSRLTIPAVCKPGGRHPTRSCSNYDNTIFALW